MAPGLEAVGGPPGSPGESCTVKRRSATFVGKGVGNMGKITCFITIFYRSKPSLNGQFFHPFSRSLLVYLRGNAGYNFSTNHYVGIFSWDMTKQEHIVHRPKMKAVRKFYGTFNGEDEGFKPKDRIGCRILRQIHIMEVS